MEIKVENILKKIRIDKYLVDIIKEYSRSEIQTFIKDEKIKANGYVVKPNYTVENGDILTIDNINEEIKITPMDLNLDIIYEDEDIAVINKKENIIVHPSHKNEVGTLVHGLRFSFTNLSDVGEIFRPGIVHRLDKDTSGIMVIAKTNEAYHHLVESFKKGNVKRFYVAIVKGYLDEKQGVINLPIGRDTRNRTKMAVTDINSKEAITKYKVICEGNGYSLIELELLTGRMHQIRVHMSYVGHPVVGDDKYSLNKEKVEHQLLHAYKIGINHPITKEYIEFESKKPIRIENFLKEVLNNEC